MEQVCEDCKYWLKQSTQVKFEGEKKTAGQCRKNPPRVIFGGLECTMKFATRFRFPFTANDDWCGKFKPKDDQKQ